MKLGEAMYKAQQAGLPPRRPGGGAARRRRGRGTDVVDADFEEVDDDKKKPRA